MNRFCRLTFLAIVALIIFGTLSSAEKTATIVIDEDAIGPGEEYTTRIMTLRFSSDGEWYTLNVVTVDEQRITFNVAPKHIPEHLNLTFDLSVNESKALDLDLDLFDDISIRLIEIVTEETESYTHTYSLYSVAPITHKYTFDEPQNLFQRVNRYGTLYVWCPEPATFDTISAELERLKTSIKGNISEEEIHQMVWDCTEREFSPFIEGHSFPIYGIPMDSEIKACIASLETLLESHEDITEYHKKDLTWECEIRAYFKERFNEDSVEGYNEALFSELFDRRDKVFIKGLTEAIAQRNERLLVEGLAENNEEPHDDDISIVRVREIEIEESETVEETVKVTHLDDSVSVMTVTQTTSEGQEIKEIEYIGTREVVLEKIQELSADGTEVAPLIESTPVVVEPELSWFGRLIQFLKSLFGLN